MGSGRSELRRGAWLSRTCHFERLWARSGDVAGVRLPFGFCLLPLRLLDDAAELRIRVTDFLHALHLRGVPTVCQGVSNPREHLGVPAG